MNMYTYLRYQHYFYKLMAWFIRRLVIKWSLTLSRFVQFPQALPSQIPQTCLELQGHLITNLPQAMLLLIIICTGFSSYVMFL